MIGLYIALGLLFGLMLPYIITQFAVGHNLYSKYLVRGKENWSRDLIASTEDEKIMFDDATEFEKENSSFIKEVEVTSGKYLLKGCYVDFGFDKAVIIVAGRSEACRYCYHFAAPYKKTGFNVLCIDNRCHGLSQGTYNTLGFEEQEDILAWVNLLHDKFNNKIVIGHGICIGSATLLYALENNKCPEYFKGLVADGMYVNFATSFNNNCENEGHPKHFVSDVFFMLFRKHTGFDIKKGPIDVIDKYQKPILFLYSKEDRVSRKEKGEELFAKCGSKDKYIHWFDKGSHSHIRANNKDEYDEAIIDFLSKYF